MRMGEPQTASRLTWFRERKQGDSTYRSAAKQVPRGKDSDEESGGSARSDGFGSLASLGRGRTSAATKRISPNAHAFTASPWAYNDHLFCLGEDGTTYVMDAKKDYEVVHRNKLGDMSLATPTVAGGSLYLRTKSALYCLRVK